MDTGPTELITWGPDSLGLSAGLTSFCQNLGDLACADDALVRQCEQILGVIDRGAAGVGCGAAFAEAFACQADHLECPPEEVPFDLEAAIEDSSPYCPGAARQSLICLGAACIPEQPACAQDDEEACAILALAACGVAAARCIADGAEWLCECAGPPAGRRFRLAVDACCDGTAWVLGACGVQPSG